jgi:hypothetical protein
MYRAKSGGKARCEVFDRAVHAGAISRLQLETDLRRAIELSQFGCTTSLSYVCLPARSSASRRVAAGSVPKVWSCLQNSSRLRMRPASS